MARGDHLAADRGTYFHHAIDLGDGRVIHYRGTLGEKSDASVRIDPMERFTSGCRTFAVEYGTCATADDVVTRALSRLGERDYSLFNNNCEHFARWCKTGLACSEQVRDKLAGVGGVGGGGAAVAGSLGVVSATGAAAGLSGAGVMSGLATVGGVVGGGAVAGLGALAAAPATVSTLAMRQVLKDDDSLPQHERDARQAGRVASAVGGVAGTAGAVGAVAAAGVPGLSAVGITTGLATIGATIGGGMVAGVAVTLAAPAAVAAGIGYGVYRLFKKKR
jgi:hypothetical protein